MPVKVKNSSKRLSDIRLVNSGFGENRGLWTTLISEDYQSDCFFMSKTSCLNYSKIYLTL